MQYRSIFLLAALCAAPAIAQEEPKREPGQAEAWEDMSDLGPGDQWARLKIDIDEKGKPTKCVALKHNMTQRRAKKQIWHMCRAMMYQWHTEPAMENGKPVKSSVIRTMVLANSKTSLKWDKAKREQKAREQAD